MAQSSNLNGTETSSEQEARKPKKLDPSDMTALDNPSAKSETNGQHHQAASAAFDATTSESNNGEKIPPKIPLSLVTAASDESCITRQPAGQVLEDSRRQKILENLQHRRKLLSWVTASRSACEANLNELSSGKKATFITEMMGSASQTMGGESEQPQQPDDATAEMKNFQKISAIAGTSSIIKRPKSHGSSLENLNAPTRELRKGANIGKRMSAAVSTLTSNVGWLSSSESSNSQVTGANLPQSTSAVAEGALINDTAVPALEKTNAQAVAVAKPIFGKRFQPQTLSLNSEKASKKTKKISSIMKKTGHGGNDAPPDLLAGTVQHNMQASGGTALEPFNPNQPLELSARASSLIEQRDALSLKFDNLLCKRHSYAAQLGSKTLVLPTKSNGMKIPQKSCLVCPRNKLNNHLLTNPLSLSDLCLPQQPPRLPTRRKTHWDCVLEEMRWMASDFIGERKWKVATAKILANASRRHCVQDDMVAKPAKKLASSMILGMDIGTTKTADATKNVGTPKSKDRVVPHLKSAPSPMKIPSLVAATPLYLDAMTEDINFSRSVSHLLSVLISDHWDSALDKGVSWDKGDSYETCRKRFDAMRNVISNNDGCEGNCRGERLAIECSSAMILDDFESPSQTMKQFSFDEISQQVQSSIELVRLLKVKSEQQKLHEPIQSEVKLCRAQLHAVYFIENLWKANLSTFTSNSAKFAAVLCGSFGTGKTVIACSLIWSNRNAGHQLVLCSVGALTRWEAELNKFHDLKVNVVSGNGWYRSPTCDVSVCDYLTFLEIMKSDLPWTKALGCLILDLRHSAFDSDRIDKSTLGTDIFEWWNSIIKFVSKFPQSNRLIIEHLGLTLNDTHAIQSDCNDTVRHGTKLLAMKLAFVYPSLFYSQTLSTGKRVVSWAKSQKSSLKTLKLNRKDDTMSSLQMIWFVLDELFLSIRFTIDSVAVKKGVVQDHWEVRVCPLTPLQDREYVCHCLDIEGSQLNKFSQPINLDTSSRDHDRLRENLRSQTQDAISNVLVNLRKVCIHSNLDYTLSTMPLFQRPGFKVNRSIRRSGSILLRGATSEPNIEAAQSVIEKSAKMKELLSVLTKQCGFSVAREPEATKNPNNEDQFEMRGAPEMAALKKIVILASLVEAQVLTSFFLSCVGIHHELLIATGLKTEEDCILNSKPCKDSHLFNLTTAAAWNWSQSILSQFNKNEATDGYIHRTCNIIISSPVTLSSVNGGICPTSADVVISIDEDWSGREATHVMSIAKKIRYKKQNGTEPSSSCKFIKIVCENTYEEKIICEGEERNVSIQNYSHDKLHTKSLKSKPDNAPKEMNGCNSASSTLKEISLRPRSVHSNDVGMDDPIGPVIPIHECAKLDLDFSIMGHTYNRSSLLFNQMPPNNTHRFPLLTKFAHENIATLSTQENEWPFFYGLRLPVTKSEGILHTYSPSKLPLDVIEPAQVLPSSLTYAPIWHYVQLFVQFSYNMSRSLDETARDHASHSHAHSNVAQNNDVEIKEKPASSKNIAINIASTSDASSLLIYEMPLPKERACCVSKERENSWVEHLLGRKRRFDELQVPRASHNQPASLQQLETAFDLNPFILGFCTARSSAFQFVPDNNHGFEPLVYVPSFLQLLLNAIRAIVHNSPAPSNIMKRKATATESSHVNQKRLKFSDPSEEKRSSIPQHQLHTSFTPHDEQLVDVTGENDWFDLEAETNPYSGFVGSEDTDIEFLEGYLESDVKKVATRQQWPSTNSVILVVQKHPMRMGSFKREKKVVQSSLSSLVGNASQNDVPAPKLLNSEPEQQFADHNERKTDTKKSKKPQQSLFTSAQDRIAVLHFKKEKPLGRSFAMREGIRFNLASSLIGSVRLRFRLSDALSNTNIHTRFMLSHHSSMLPYLRSGHTEFGPFLFGVRASLNVSKLIRRERSRSGITLPMGVKRPRLARKLTSSLEETKEPWTDTEDKLLRESVLKYGMNWQLASRSVSDFNLSRPQDVLLTSRRSPNQCQLRWESITTEKGDAISCVTESTASCDSSSNSKFFLFPDNSINSRNEYFIHRNSLAAKTPDQKHSRPHYYGPWIRNPNSIPSPDKSPENSNGASKSVSDRIKQLKETSKKRRITTTTIPGSTTVGNETSVRLVPVHSSHRESIQAATSNWPQPRKDMWPMEFLEYTAKSKAGPPVVDSNNSKQEVARAIPSHPTRPSSSQQPHPAQPVPYTPAYANLMQGNPPYYGIYPNQHRPHHPPKPPS